MDTIELIPGLVFERISDSTSPPSSSLSFNSAPPTRRSLPSNQSRHPYSTLPSRKNPITSPTSPVKTRATPDSNSTEKSNKMEPRNDRGYYSLGSGVAKASKLMKSQNNKPNGGDYGVAVSIKGIKGHPFVILEDKENHRHMVAAPDPSGSETSSDHGSLPNGHTHTDAPSPMPTAPPRRSGQSKGRKMPTDSYQPPNNYQRPQPVNHQPVSASNAGQPLNRGRTKPQNEQLVKPSEVKAAQPKPSTLHMRSPRSRTSHERSQTLPRNNEASSRSRSMSPNRAMAANKKNRSRSMSPPRKVKGKRVDDNNVQPVSSLIGFFETKPEHESPKAHPNKVPLVERKRPASVPPKNKYTFPSPTTNDTSKRSPSRPRFESKEIDVTPDSLKANLSITTATVPSKPGTTPAGRYFALTSPAATSRASKPFPQSSPRLLHLKSGKDDNSSHLSSSTGSSETGMTTDEGTLNILSDDHQNPPNIYSRDLKPVSNKPWELTSREPAKRNRSGVVSEPLTKPSNTGDLYGEKTTWKESPQKTKKIDERSEPKTVVSKAKIIGPSHQLLQKTKRKRKIQKVSTSNPNSRASSVCGDYSDLDYSDAESLGVSLRISDDEDDEKSKNSSRPTSRHEYLLSPGSDYSGIKKSPSIVFEKISSQDTTKHPVEMTQVDHEYLSSNHQDPTVKDLQDNIAELRKTVKNLQQTADENLENYDLLNELERKLERVEDEKRSLEEEIVEGRKMLQDLEKKLGESLEEIRQLRKAEMRDRVTIQAQAKELEDMKNQLNEMDTELENQLSSNSHENQMAKKLSELQRKYDGMLADQNRNERLLQRKEDELAMAKQALKEESDGHDDEVDMMRKMHEDILSRLRDELGNLRQESLSAVEARPLLEDQISSLRGEVQRLKELQERRRHSSSSSSSSSRSENGNEDLLEETRDQLEKSHDKVELLQNEIKELQNKMKHMESNNSHSPVDKLYQDIDNLKQEKKSLESDLSSVEKQRSLLKGQVKSAQCDREEAERHVRDLESESSRLKGRIQELETEVERLKKDLLRSRRNLEAQVCDLEHQMAESEQRTAGLHADKANLEKQLSEAKVTADHPSLDTLLADLHDLEQLKLDLEVELENEKKLAESREEEIFELMEELRKMSSGSEMEDRNQTLRQLEEFKEKTAKELEQVRLEVEGKARMLREAERNNSRLQEELRRMDIELEEELNERESALAENNDLERKNHEFKTSMAQKNLEIEEKGREIEKLQNILSLTEDNKLNLEEKLDSVEDEKTQIMRNLHGLKEDIKDKDLEIDELNDRIKSAKLLDVDESKLRELEHENKMNEMQVGGLKQALEDKQNDLEDAEEKLRELQSEMNDQESKMEETLRKLRDVEKQRRFAAKEAEDLTVLLSEKIADLDEAQRRLRRSEAKLQDLEDSSVDVGSLKLELEKAKRTHAHEMQRCQEEGEDANNALLASEKAVDQLQAELQIYEDRYQAAAMESMELERQRQNAANKLSDAQNEVREKGKELNKAEEKINKLEKALSEADDEAEDLANQAQEAIKHKKEAEFNCKNLQDQLEEKEKELKIVEKKFEKLNDKLQKSGDLEEETRKEQEEEVRRAEEEAGRAKQEVDLLKLRLAQEEDKCNELEEKIHKLEELVEEQTRAEEESVLETNKLLRDLMEARKELEERNKAFEQAQHLINTIEKKLEHHESSNGESAGLMLQMQHHNDIAQSKILELEENLSQTINDAEFAQAALKDTEDRMSKAEKLVEDLEEELKEKESNFKKVEKKANDLREEIQKKDDEKKKAEEKSESLRKQVEMLQLEMKERSDWSERKRAELEHEVKVLEVELRSSEDDLDKMEREKHELEEKIAELEKSTGTEQKENDGAIRKELQLLRDSLDDKTQQVFAAEDTIYRQKEVIEELTAIQQATEKSSLEQMDSYMAESDKQFEQLKAHLQERNDQIKEAQTEKQELQNQIDFLSEELDKATSDATRTRTAQEEDSRRLDELEDLIKELREKLKQEQKMNRELRDKDSSSPTHNQANSEDVEELVLRLHEEEDAKEEAISRLKSMGEQLHEVNEELEELRKQKEMIGEDHDRQKLEIEDLRIVEKEAEVMKEKIAALEDKLQQEANELNAIDTHHRRTEMKLREILIQAEDETNKANSEKEMLAIRLQSLKQQLQDAEMEVNSSEEERRSLQEDLQEQRDENYQLRQTLASLRPQAPSKSASGNLFTPV